MREYIFLSAVLSLLCFVPFVLKAQTNGCVDCHQELDGELKAPVEDFKVDVHQKIGLSCVDCHGGNVGEEDFDLAKDKSFRGTPERAGIPGMCGKCHSDSRYMRNFNPGMRIDQLSLYWISQHGQALRKGDTKVAVCTDCHGVHSILSATHPKAMTFAWNVPQTCGRCHSDQDYMREYKIPVDQNDKYEQSVHAHALFEKKDLSAPVCNDCHGNHGAMPPEISSISFVCRQCHPGTGDLFSKSPHKAAYEAMKISECEACHGNHSIPQPSDEMFGVGEESICIKCHDSDSEQYQVAARIKVHLDDFKERFRRAEALLHEAEQKGVEVSEAKFKLSQANTLLVMVRNLTHGLSLTEVEETIDEGKAVLSEATRVGEQALVEARHRRRGLFISVCLIILLAIALYLKIRQVERKMEGY